MIPSLQLVLPPLWVNVVFSIVLGGLSVFVLVCWVLAILHDDR